MKNARFSLKKVFLWVALVNIVWLGLTLIVLFFVKIPHQDQRLMLNQFNIPRHCLRVGYSILFQTVFFYFSLNGYYRLMQKKAAVRAYLLWSLLLLSGSIVYYWLEDLLAKKEVSMDFYDISLKIFTYSILCICQLGVAGIIVAVIGQLDEKNQQIQRSRVLEQQKTQLEKEKMQANYLFLKAQINPHFLHNTLNFLYARSLPFSSELSEGILTLSEIMRYGIPGHTDAGNFGNGPRAGHQRALQGYPHHGV